MSIRDIRIPYLSFDEIKLSSQDIYNRYNSSDEIPVPIELIIEKDVGVELIIIPGLREGFGVDGFLSNKLSSITIDQELFDRYSNRYHFTLAHEIAHMFLHKDVYREIGFHNVEEWKNTIYAFDPKTYTRMERQADIFAGTLLVPEHHLQKHFSHSIERLQSEGFDIHENKEIIIKYIATALSKIFEVSPSAIEVRINQERLIS